MTANKVPKRLLWMDNQGPDQIRSYRAWLLREGWEIVVTVTIDQTMQAIANAYSTGKQFSMFALDQGVPYEGSDAEGVKAGDGPPYLWGGCLITHWLRNADTPQMLPNTYRAAWGALVEKYGPSKHPMAPIMIVTAFIDSDVQAAVDKLRERDAHPIRESRKPLRLERFKDVFFEVLPDEERR